MGHLRQRRFEPEEQIVSDITAGLKEPEKTVMDPCLRVGYAGGRNVAGLKTPKS